MISIITPVLNGAKYISSNIESISKLTIPYEHIVVDGGSTDGTQNIVKGYSNVKLVKQNKKNGMYGAIHQGFEIARGEYLSWVNSDDQIIAEGYEVMYNRAMIKKADFIYSHGILNFIEKYQYKKKYARLFTRTLLKSGVFPFVQPSVIYSTKSYKLVGGLKYQKFRLIGDRDLFQRMAMNTKVSFLYVSVFSSLFLRYENSLLYRNLERRKLEYKYCIKTDVKWYHKLIFKLSGPIRRLEWIFKNLNRIK